MIEVIGERYRILEPLGKGGMGEVFRARDEALGREVALKLLSRRAGASSAHLQRFVREARAQASVEHPNLVRLFDCRVDEDPPWLAMELVEGDDLLTVLLRRGLLSVPALLRLAREVGGALDALHQRGVLHRDVKPANIMLRHHDGAAVLMDLGLAGITDATVLTGTGMVVGTPRYYAPEMLRGEESTPALDQFQLGVTLFEAATGLPRVPGQEIPQIMAALTTGRLTPFPDDPPLPSPLRQALDRAVEPEPEKRFPSCRELARAMAAKDAPAGPGPAGGEGARSARHAPASVSDSVSAALPAPRRRGLLGALVLAALAAAGLLLLRPDPPPAPTEVEWEVIGDAVRVVWSGGSGEERLLIGDLESEARPEPLPDGRRRLVHRALPVGGSLTVRFTWPGGVTPPRAISGAPQAITGLAGFAGPEQLRLAVERPCQVVWEGTAGAVPVAPDQNEIPLPIPPGEDLELRFRERGLWFRARWSWHELERAAVDALHRAFDPVDMEGWRAAVAAASRAEEANLPGVRECFGRNYPWLPGMLRGELPLDERRFLLRTWEDLQCLVAMENTRGVSSQVPGSGPVRPGSRPNGYPIWSQPEVRRPELSWSGAVRPVESEAPLHLSIRADVMDFGIVKAFRRPNSVEAIHFVWPPDAPEAGTEVALAVEVGLLVRESRLRVLSERGEVPFVAHLWHPMAGRVSRPRHVGWISLVVPAEVAPAPGTPMRMEMAALVDEAFRGTPVRGVEVSWPREVPASTSGFVTQPAPREPRHPGPPLTREQLLAEPLRFRVDYSTRARGYLIEAYYEDAEEELFRVWPAPPGEGLAARVEELVEPFEGRKDAPFRDDAYRIMERLRAEPGLLYQLYLASRAASSSPESDQR